MAGRRGAKRGRNKVKDLNIEQGSLEWKRLRKRCREDLFWFNAKVLGHEKLGSFQMTYRAHYALCRFAERRTGIPAIDNSRVQLIQVGRGWGKSLLVTKGRTMQRLITDQNWAAGIMNERQENANKFLAGIKAEFEQNAFLQFLFPKLIPDFRKTVWKADQITIQRTKPNPVNPSVLAAGTESTVTGVHLNEWIGDDLLSEDMAKNLKAGLSTEVEKINSRVIQIQPLLTNPKRDPITFIGTPWYPGDTYEYIEKVFGRGEDPNFFVWNLKFPDGNTQSVTLEQKGELAIFRFKPRQNGICMFPEMFDDDTLDKLREDDPVFYSAQYELNPIAAGLASFKEEYLRTYDWANDYQIQYKDHENRIRFTNRRELVTILSVDPAQSKKETAARSAIVVTASDGERIFLLETWADRVKPSDLGNKVLEFYQKYQPERVIIEDVAYQIALADILDMIGNKAGIQFPIYTFKPGTDIKKYARIDSLEPYFRKGYIHYNPRSQQNFLEEYIRFSPDVKGPTKDILDALSFQKESWEALSFLGGGDENSYRTQWREREQTKINQIKSRYDRNRRDPDIQPTVEVPAEDPLWEID